ncbi:MAG: 50S ribosomal protein L10 [Clostridiales bacterium]|nr:50S ribosomal protein L10 [Clostridiales bacterium]
MPSKSILEAKKQKVLKLADTIKSSRNVVLIDFRGLTVEQDTVLRKEMRKISINYFVVKNSLLKFAFENFYGNSDEEYLNGPTALAISDGDIFSLSKFLINFSNENEAFKIKSGFTNGELVTLDDMRIYASIPSKEVLISKFLGSLLAPIANLVRVLDAITKKQTLNEIEGKI